MAPRKKSKLDALYPERELQFGDLTVLVKAAPGLYAADLIEAFGLAEQLIISEQKWSPLLSDVWPSIQKIVFKCVTFDEPGVTLEDLPVGPLGEIVEAVKQLTIESAGDPKNSRALPLACSKIYGLELVERAQKDTQTSSDDTSQTSA